MKEIPRSHLENRINIILDWIKNNKDLLESTHITKITINLKGHHVSGEIVNYPDFKL